jgi:hypothetical protein
MRDLGNAVLKVIADVQYKCPLKTPSRSQLYEQGVEKIMT